MTPMAIAAMLIAMAATEAPRYNRDVRPILAEHCFVCHGQDGGARKADLRLDTAEGAAGVLGGGVAASALLARVASDDADMRMPPSGPGLSAKEIGILRDWVAAGAVYEPHWAYVPPVRPETPSVKDDDWVRTPIDAFVLARLEAEGLAPAPEADAYTLIRRLSYDLTGLPPAVADADAFANDASPERADKAVDRLLASPHYGEHMARYWLDLARYADSAGYHIDAKRTMWPYRDWVIGAYNANMPFDRFTIEQIAGDMLPEATIDQRIATGFHRNTMFNEEGGIDQEEFRTKAVVDRVGTTMTAWMGTTMACAECHDHKYDPFSQAEFYQLYSFFNNVPELGGGTNKSRAPLVQLEAPMAVRSELDGLRSVVAELTAQRTEADLAEKKEGEEPTPLNARIAALEKRMEELKASIPTTLVMEEMAEPRETRIHERGDFLSPGDRVEPAVPAVWGGLAVETGRRATRLDLAEWLVARENPLTARVVMNRLWAQFFGRGLVSTADDFGTRGAMASHPELLDWLAVEFMESGWNVKRMVRLIADSAVYRQTSAVDRAAYEADPQNVLLARGPRFRLDAEGIRDTAMAASGLLSGKVGGPSVFPYQPAGLWTEKMLTGYDVGDWPATYGDDLYRRGMYTFRRRSVPYPTFATFDAPTFEYCAAARSRTNTPLQALTTLNDPQFVEAARVMAERIAAHDAASLDDRIAYAFRLCLTRPPSDAERTFLASFHESQRAAFAEEPAEAQALIANGRAPVKPYDDPAALAAWTAVANVLLNLDETMTKE